MLLTKLLVFYEESEVFDDEGSIEHILSESGTGDSINIGNLILLERRLNEEADNLNYTGKINVYKKSSYKWMQDFLSNYDEWDNNKIIVRSKEMARIYYTQILGKKLPPEITAN